MEIPKSIWEKSVEGKSKIIGAIEGFGVGFVRTGAGTYDIITFFLPIPENYSSIMYPETIFSDKKQ